MSTKIYSQLIAVVGLLVTMLPAHAHQSGYHDHAALNGIGGFWHKLIHTVEACVSLFSVSYLVFLAFLVGILVFITYKVKWANRGLVS